jgi:hypothetical protein
MQAPAAAMVSPRTGEELIEAAVSVLQNEDVSDASLARLHQHLWLRVFTASEEQGGSGSCRDYLLLIPESAKSRF